MTEKPNITEQAFDILSSIPYLKRIMKGLFVMGTILGMVPFVVGGWESNSELVKKGSFFIAGNLFFCGFFISGIGEIEKGSLVIEKLVEGFTDWTTTGIFRS